MTKNQLPESFHVGLISCLLRAKQNIAFAAAQFDLTGAQAFALLLIDTATPRSMKSYSDAHYCDAANMTGLIDGLEEKGLVTRRQDPADRRIKVIHLEPVGVKIRKQLLDAVDDVNADLLSPLSDREQKEFVAAMHKIAANV
jgi:DNA-binding MarR family transcriptional regulator